MNDKDLKKKATRKWPGLGPNPLIIDLSEFEGYEDCKPAETEEAPAEEKKAPPAKGKGKGAAKEEEAPSGNEVLEEIALENTLHHKSIIKYRNRVFKAFADQFKT